MKPFIRLAHGVDIAPLKAELDAHPELWDAHRDRTFADGSPFLGTSDIWLRYRALEELTTPEAFLEPHFAVWHPAARHLPAARAIAMNLMADLDGVMLGGVLITRIPAGVSVLPHHDRGSWHAEFMNVKVYVPIQSNPDCVNRCDGEMAVMAEGEAWWFDNLRVHSVENRGTTDRITLICCLRAEPW